MATIEAQSKLLIISKAAILIGEEPITSLTDPRYARVVGDNLFELLYENELQSHPWRFASKKIALAATTAPLNQWSNAFTLPSDMLLPRYVYPVDLDYEIYGTVLYTNRTSVDFDYLFKPDVNNLPAYFNTLLIYALARDMINPITESGVAKMEAFENKYKRQRDRALYADSQGRPAKPVQDNPFVSARNRQ